MRHQIFGRKLHRNRKLRERLFKQLIIDFVSNDRLKTSLANAKAIRPDLEKYINRAKDTKPFTRRYLLSKLNDAKTCDKLIEVATGLTNIQGGYTKILKLESRLGDNSQQAIVLWSHTKEEAPKEEVKKTKV